MNSDKTYRPVFGIIEPNEAAVVALYPTTREGYAPLVVTVPKDAITIPYHDAATVTLQNHTPQRRAYILLTVPAATTAVASMPWMEIVKGMQQRLKTKQGKVDLWHAINRVIEKVIT